MVFPSPPDFQSGEPLAGHFAVQLRDNRIRRMASQGRSINRRIQLTLNNLGYRAATSANSTPRALTADGAIGEHTVRALQMAALDHARQDPQGGYGQISEVLNQDWRARRSLSSLAYRWALWLAFVRGVSGFEGIPWNNVVIPAGYRLPAYGVAPDDDRGASGPALEAVSWIDGVQPPPVAPVRTTDATQRGTIGTTPTPGTTPGTTPRSTDPEIARLQAQADALSAAARRVAADSATLGTTTGTAPGLAVVRPGDAPVVETGFLSGNVEGTGVPKWTVAAGVGGGLLWLIFKLSKGGRRR